jgi:hypothetical protein
LVKLLNIGGAFSKSNTCARRMINLSTFIKIKDLF